MDIPIVINNFNRLTTTRKLVEDLTNLGYTNVHILDNNSTYPPLLAYYDTNPCTIKKLESNMEFLAIYNSGYINEWLGKREWMAYTDCDIELNPNTPKDFIETLIRTTERYNKTKGGLALKISDLPTNDYADHYKWRELRDHWSKELEPDVYDACVDTTFCVIKPGRPFDYQAIRMGGNFTAKHKPWYTDFSNLDEEELYYLSTSSDNSSYKRFYHAYMKK